MHYTSKHFKLIRRSWSERLFSWPWNPFKATREDTAYAYAVQQIEEEKRRTRAEYFHMPPRPMPPPSTIRRECDAPPGSLGGSARDLLVPLRRLSASLKADGAQPGTAAMIAEYIDQSIAEIERLREKAT